MGLDYTSQTILSTLVPGAGEILSSMDSQQAMDLINQAADAEGNISLPILKNLILDKIPPTQLAALRDDPAYRQQQAEADAQLNDIIQGGGLTLADKAALDAIRNKTELATSASNNQIANQMAQRGTLDSGSQLAMQLANNQNAATNEAATGEAAAGQAQARLFQAIQQRNANATSGLNRKFQEGATVASAQDAINAGNTAIANVMNEYNTVQLPQQNFQNQLAVNNAKMQAAELKAGNYGAMAKDVTGSSPLGKADLGMNILSAYKGGSVAPANAAPGDPSQNPYGPGGGAPAYNPSEGNAAGAGAAPNEPPVSSPSDWGSYPGSSGGALSGQSTKSGTQIASNSGPANVNGQQMYPVYDANGNLTGYSATPNNSSAGRNF